MNHRDQEAYRPITSGHDCPTNRRLWQQRGTAMAQRRVVTAAVRPGGKTAGRLVRRVAWFGLLLLAAAVVAWAVVE